MNVSDSCIVRNIRLTSSFWGFSQSETDELYEALLADDSIVLAGRQLNYRSLLATCDCPDTVYAYAVRLEVDPTAGKTVYFKPILIDCDSM